jgi:hypothetical protein
MFSGNLTTEELAHIDTKIIVGKPQNINLTEQHMETKTTETEQTTTVFHKLFAWLVVIFLDCIML